MSRIIRLALRNIVAVQRAPSRQICSTARSSVPLRVSQRAFSPKGSIVAHCTCTMGICGLAIAMPTAVALCAEEPSTANESESKLGISELSDMAEEVNSNLGILLPRAIAEFEAELKSGQSPYSKASPVERKQEMLRRYDELLERVSDAVRRNRGVSKLDVDNSMYALGQVEQNNAISQEDADRFAAALHTLANLRAAAVRFDEVSTDSAPIPLELVLQILSTTMHGLMMAMNTCISSVDEAAEDEQDVVSARNEAIGMCYAARSELLSVQIQQKYGISGEELAAAFEVHSHAPLFKETLRMLIEKQRKHFCEIGMEEFAPASTMTEQ